MPRVQAHHSRRCGKPVSLTLEYLEDRCLLTGGQMMPSSFYMHPHHTGEHSSFGGHGPNRDGVSPGMAFGRPASAEQRMSPARHSVSPLVIREQQPVPEGPLPVGMPSPPSSPLEAAQEAARELRVTGEANVAAAFSGESALAPNADARRFVVQAAKPAGGFSQPSPEVRNAAGHLPGELADKLPVEATLRTNPPSAAAGRPATSLQEAAPPEAEPLAAGQLLEKLAADAAVLGRALEAAVAPFVPEGDCGRLTGLGLAALLLTAGMAAESARRRRAHRLAMLLAEPSARRDIPPGRWS